MRTLALLFAVTFSTLIYVEVWDSVERGSGPAFDNRILRATRTAHDIHKPVGPQWLPEVARDISALGSVTVVGLTTLAVAGLLTLSRRFHSLVLLVASVLGGFVLTLVLKQTFGRSRPDAIFHLTTTMSQSFPSGHAMLSTVMYLTLGAILAELINPRRLKAYILTLALVVSGLTGLSRIYLGVHYPTDVVAGWAAGLAWALTTMLIVHELKGRLPRLRKEANKPPGIAPDEPSIQAR